MAPPKIPIAPISREKYIHYWHNALECFEGMEDAAVAERWHLTALNGIHCVIAAADALLVYTAGIRSKSRNHNDVFTLLTQHVDDPQKSQMLGHGLYVLQRKSEIEYSAKRIGPTEGHQLVKRVERFSRWVRDKIGQ
jgi:hypothetical protein